MATNKNMLDKVLSMSDEKLRKATELSDDALEEVFGGHDFFQPIADGYMAMIGIMKRMEGNCATYEDYTRIGVPAEKLQALGYGPGQIVPTDVVRNL